MSTEAQHNQADVGVVDATASSPKHRGLVLTTLMLIAAVANLNLAVANVALPSIGKAFNASQVSLDLVAVGYSLGLAASVLWLGALGDRYGRKQMLIIGTLLAMPASLLAACVPSVGVLIVARLVGGRLRCRSRSVLKEGERSSGKGVVLPESFLSSNKQREMSKETPDMGMLRVISRRGDDRVQWNEQDVQTRGAETLAAIREAERIFAQGRARGATAYRVEAASRSSEESSLTPRLSRWSWCQRGLVDER